MERPLKERLVGATILVVMGVLLIPWALDGKSRNQVNYENQELTLPGSNDQNMETRTISLEASTPGGSAAPLESDMPSQGRSAAAKPAGNLPVTSLPSKNTSRQDQENTGQSQTAAAGQSNATTADGDIKADVEVAPAKPSAANAKSSDTQARVQASTSKPPSTFVDTPAAKPAASDAASSATSKPVPTKATSTATTTSPASSSTTPGQWAVQVGAFAKQENAERLAERLRDKDYKAFVMRNVVDGRVRFRVRVGPVEQRAQADLLANALREDRQPAKVLAHP